MLVMIRWRTVSLPRSSPAAWSLSLNFVAMTASFRRPASAFPMCSSDAPSPYAFAVSKKLMPWSSAAWTMRVEAACSATRSGSPKLMAPSPMTETSTSDQPSFRLRIAFFARTRSAIAQPVDVVDAGARRDLARALRRVVRRVGDELARELGADAGAGGPDVDHERAEGFEHRADTVDRVGGSADH